VETAVVLLITGLITSAVVQGQELIRNARVRDVISQQQAAEGAFLAFQDRFHALPGDYSSASTNINCGASSCLNGNGNGRIEPGANGAIHEEILAWNHLASAGFLSGDYRMSSSSVTAPAVDNTPVSVFGGYLAVVTDNNWGYSGNTANRHNLKTGNNIPVGVLAEVDQKIDDGRPGSGRFQFSAYAGAGPTPLLGGTSGACTDANTANASWQPSGGSNNCGAASLVY